MTNAEYEKTYKKGFDKGYAAAIADVLRFLRASDPDSIHPFDSAGRVYADTIESGRWKEIMKT